MSRAMRVIPAAGYKHRSEGQRGSCAQARIRSDAMNGRNRNQQRLFCQMHCSFFHYRTHQSPSQCTCLDIYSGVDARVDTITVWPGPDLTIRLQNPLLGHRRERLSRYERLPFHHTHHCIVIHLLGVSIRRRQQCCLGRNMITVIERTLSILRAIILLVFRVVVFNTALLLLLLLLPVLLTHRRRPRLRRRRVHLRLSAPQRRLTHNW